MNQPASDPQRRLGCGMIAAAWLLVLGLLYVFFDDQLDRQQHPNRNIESRGARDTAELVLRRNRMGHYVAPGTINGQSVTFLLDTGATVVSVPAHLGPTLGLIPGTHQRVITANGEVIARATRIGELGLGPFQLREVRAHLNPGMGGDQVLLGMSVLRQLEFTQRGDTLTLRPYRG
jgi:aspartyl protease family protein